MHNIVARLIVVQDGEAVELATLVIIIWQYRQSLTGLAGVYIATLISAL